MALVKGLAALSRFLAKQIPGKTQGDILGMLRKSATGPLRRKFGKNVWWHATPEEIPKGKVVPFEAFKDVRDKDVERELVKRGTYLAQKKSFAEQMGRRLLPNYGQEPGPTIMPLVLRKGTRFLKENPRTIEREALRPRHVFSSDSYQNIPLGQRLIANKKIRNDFADELLDALEPNEIKVLERYTGALGTKGTKALDAYIEKTGGRRGFPGRSEIKRKLRQSFDRAWEGHPDEVLDVIKQYDLHPNFKNLDEFGRPERIKFFENVAVQLGSEYSNQLRKVMEKMGVLLPKIRKATLERWKKRGYSGYKGDPSVEAVIWPGEEKKVLRHLLADFKEEYGGLTAGLLPLISMLRGKREE